MREWHPISKGVVVLGGGIALLLLVSDPEASFEPVADSLRTGALRMPMREFGEIDLSPLLPASAAAPADAFPSMVGRPLFVMDRRAAVWVEPTADIEFVGSLESEGELHALIRQGPIVDSVSVGEWIDAWQLVSLSDRLARLVREDAELELRLFE